MAREDYLFTGPDWHSVDLHQRQQMAAEIEKIDPDCLLNTSVDDLALYFSEKYQIDVPVLDEDNLTVDQREKQIDVSGDRSRYISDRSRPFYITGSEIEVEIPFTGEAGAFNIQPNPYTLNPPRACTRGNLLTFQILGTNFEATQIREEIERTVRDVQSYLTNLRANVSVLNGQLLGEARVAIEARRNKLLVNHNTVASLGFKMKEKSAPNTYAPSEVWKRVSPVMPAASSEPYKPEPAPGQNGSLSLATARSNMWDLFISHASEDKVSIARPLYNLLSNAGYSVWFDEATLTLGDSLRQKIDEGLSNCRFGVVIISPHFLSKSWPKRELDGLFAREDEGRKVILPVWHDIAGEEISVKSPMLAAKLAAKSSDGIDRVVSEIKMAIGEPINELDGIHQNKLPNPLMMPDKTKYFEACENETLFIEYCEDVLKVGAFQIGSVMILQSGAVGTDTVNRVLRNFSKVFVPAHYKLLFQLGCLLYDHIKIEDVIFDQLIRQGLTFTELEDLYCFIPKTASNRLSRMFFNAFYKLKSDSIKFGSPVISSKAFANYCISIDIHRTLEILRHWRASDKFKGVTVGDSVSCVVKLIDSAANEYDSHLIKHELKSWYKDGILDAHMSPNDHAWKDVRRIIGW